ncbi:MAG TPA: amidophosphoribosyltransferase [Gaiellaceae bacterium]|nr:amidophosphoribosyltransferase [Gaiellaceae bacterium]
MCGVFGVYAPDRDVARLTYFGLFALQHRGQESAGIAVSEQGRLTALRDLGLVSQVFDEQKLHGLRGSVAIGHTRYSTTGSSQWSNAQPLVQHGRARTVALGHNGNLVNATALRDEMRAGGVTLRATSDSEVIAALIANDEAPLEEAVAGAMRRLEGAYSIVALSEGRLVAFRDPHGFRPLVLGKLHDDWVVASETCALDLVGAEFVREVERGEAVFADADGLRSVQAVEPQDGGALCIFEFFYLARPDTQLSGVEVHGARVRMGERLAAEAPVEADLVLPIPDSGTPAAIGFSRALEIPFSEGLIKNRYVGRTFIQPDQELRRQGIRLKFNPLAEVAGKRLVVVDDSIVRGNTTRQIVQMLFDAGAAEVHVRISSPPVIGQCFYGIDLADPDELIAAAKTVDEVREYIGATSLAYLSHDGLVEATSRPESELCRACLTREYPTPVPVEHAKLRYEPARA